MSKIILKLLFIIIFSLLLTNCATQTPSQNPFAVSNNLTEESLAEIIEPQSSATSSPLNNKEREAFLIENVKICELPCILGFSVEKSLQETLDYLNFLGASVSFEESITDYDYLYVPDIDMQEEIIFNHIDIYFDGNEIVGYIFKSEGYSNLESVRKIWGFIDPYNVVEEYGYPTEIYLLSSGPDFDLTTNYTLWLLYKEYNFLLKYSGALEANDQYRFCSSFSGSGNLIGNFEVFVLDSQLNMEILHFSEYDDFRVGNRIMDFETATGISKNDFIDKFIENKDYCFETSKSIWLDN